MKSNFLLLICFLLFSDAIAQISLSSMNDFQNGTTMGWQVGAGGVNPVNVPNGGPNGTGDNYLAASSDGSGVNGKLVIFNTGSTWTGNWTGAGVNYISFMARNSGATNLTLRISLDGGGGRISTTNGVFLAAGSSWTMINFPVGLSDFTLVGGFNIASTLSNVSIMRILHNTMPSWFGADIVASLHLDVIAAKSSLLVNDDAPNAIMLTVGSGCSGSPHVNTGATQSAGEPFAACKGTAGYKTVWYKFLAPSTGNVRISNDYSGGTLGSDSRLALFSATNVNNYATFTNIACDDDNGVIIADRSILYATGLTPVDTYYIQVDGKEALTATGTFCLTVDEMNSSMLATATACASGQPLTSVNDNYTGWQSVADASGKLIALINNPTGGATTSTYTSGQHINTGSVREDPVSFNKYLDRNFTINNPAITIANVQFFYLASELTALQSVDPEVTLANLAVTRQTGTTCDNNFIAANGTNSLLTQAGNGAGTGFNWVLVNTSGFSRFFLHTKKAYVPLKTFLHGAYLTGQGRHKDVTTTWRNILQAQALLQPYNISPFNYAGTEIVTAAAFTSTAGVHTDVVDWVLLELRDAVTSATVIARSAAFIREDGRIVDLDGVSDISFRTIPDGNYHIVIRHRNHMAIRTPNSSPKVLNSTMGIPAALHDFSSAQTQAFQNTSNSINSAQRDLGGDVFGMWGGNVNSDTQVRATGLASQNDYLGLITALGNNPAALISNVYNRADLNLDGTMRATGLSSVNDYLFLIGALDNNPAKIVTQHQ